jgi:vitamin B12 transporter
MVRVIGCIVVLLTALACLASAQELKEEVQKVEPVVVTATKVETPAERIGASVTVVTEEEIRNFNYTRIEEALRAVPGVDIQRAGSPGKATTLRIRGAGGQQVQVLVDGMRVSSPTLGAADLAELTLDAVDRIEVLRGPQSTLYGANAIGGVVNIITKKGQGPPKGAVWAEAGNYQTFRESANTQGAFGPFNFNLSVTRFDTAGQFDNDRAGQTSIGGRIGYDFPWKGELSVTGRYEKLNLELPISSTFPTTVFDPNSRNDLETWLYNAAYTQKIFDWWHLRARFGQWSNFSDFKDSPPPADDSVIRSRINADRLEGELLNTFDIGPWTSLTVGVEERYETGKNRTSGDFPSQFSEELNTVSLFGQGEIRLFDRLFLGGGVRWENSDTFEDSVTGRVSAAFVIRETGSKLRFAWGQGFRAPTINDLFFPGFGNTDLAPEKSEGWEIGVDQKFWGDRVRAGATYFNTHFTNLIQFNFDPGTGLFRPENVGRARTEGVEVYLEVDPLPWLTLYGNYTYLDARDITAGTELRRVPRNSWATGLEVTPHERVRLFVQAKVVSSQLESTFAGRNPGYYRLDVGGTFRILGKVGYLGGLDLTARIDNVTDQRYDEVQGFPALGINALVGLRATFN